MPDPETGAGLRPCYPQHRLLRPFVSPFPPPSSGISALDCRRGEQSWERTGMETSKSSNQATVWRCDSGGLSQRIDKSARHPSFRPRVESLQLASQSPLTTQHKPQSWALRDGVTGTNHIFCWLCLASHLPSSSPSSAHYGEWDTVIFNILISILLRFRTFKKYTKSYHKMPRFHQVKGLNLWDLLTGVFMT